jgi:hypothetical protein
MTRLTPRTATTVLLLAACTASSTRAADPATRPLAASQWASPDADGHLTYKPLPSGDRIMDFSAAGYMGGGVALPTVPVKQTVAPSGAADDTAAIQAALDTVAQFTPDSNGHRGAVLLHAGTFTCSAPLAIKASGVVLRGSGSGPDGTTIRMSGQPHTCVTLGAARPTVLETGGPVPITDAYVPTGADAVTVADASHFSPGDTVLVRRPNTEAWVHFMGMDTLVRDGKPQTWIGGGAIDTERRIKSVDGNRLTLDVPLSDNLDAKLLNPPGASVAKVAVTGRITQAGVENLHMVAPSESVTINQPLHKALQITAGAEDCWARDLRVDDTVNSVGVSGRRITVQRVVITHKLPTTGAAKPADFTAGGSQILFDRCSAAGDNVFYFVTGARCPGPNVLLHCTFTGGGWIQPHARWATGLLVDNCAVPGGGIDFMNRGIYGSGHGWTVGSAVAWNSTAKSLLVQQPPGSMNFAIGCTGQFPQAPMPGGDKEKLLPQGTVESPNTPVAPQSLYLAQLRQRLGDQAVKNAGY